jgi:hypothetical protein
MKDYIELPLIQETFTGVGIPGLTAKQLARTPDKAIYLRWDDVYEVFRVKIKEESEMFGKTIGKHEHYPNSEDFGKTAWCFVDEKIAWRRYESL